MIMGLDGPTAGTVRVNGRPYGQLKRPLHQVGAVLEVRAVHGGRSAYHHLLCLAQSNGIGKRRVHEVLGTVGLTDVAGQRAKAFSLGMSQRLGVAAALLGDPGVLVCDEPVNGLDPEGIRWIRTLLRRLAAEGRTVLVSSHLMSEMALTADHLLVIGKGRILADGSMGSVISRVASTTVTVASPRMDDLLPLLRGAGATVRSSGPQDAQITGISGARVGDLAASASIPIHRLDEAGPSLEEAFMELTSGSVQFPASGGSGQ
jgi:ABC-2 type transport system ATP-binding protein